MSPLRRSLLAFVLATTAFAPVVVTRPAHADVGAPGPEARKRAAEAFAEGQAAFAQRDFLGAARRFEAAAAIAPHPATFLNASEAWEAAGKLERAAEACDRVLADPGAEARFTTAARARLARVEPRIGWLVVTSEPGIRVRIDEEPEGGPRRLRVAPGRHVVTFVKRGGALDEHVVDVTASETVSVAPLADDAAHPAVVAPVAAPSGASSPAGASSSGASSSGASSSGTSPGSGPPLGSWVAFGAAGVAAGVGGAFGIVTLRARDDFDATPSASTRDAFYDNRTITNVAFVAAGVLAVTGAVVWLIAPSSRSSEGARAAGRGGSPGAVLPGGFRF